MPSPNSKFDSVKIAACADAIRRRLPALKILVFGSVARGQANEDSDLDFLVVLPDAHGIAHPCFEAKLAIMAAKVGVPTDVVVITEAEASNPSNPFIEAALREGILIP